MASYEITDNDKYSGKADDNFDIQEKYYYILQNYDLTKLIKNQEQLALIQSDYLDLNEKLKILDNVLKLRASRYKRNEIIVDKEGENSGSLTLAEPGYYKVIIEGGSGASKFVRNDYEKKYGLGIPGSLIRDDTYDVDGEYVPYINIVDDVKPSDNCNFFNNYLWPYRNLDGAVFYFSQDLHWYLITIKDESTINFKYGSAEVNKTSCFMHREIGYTITQESFDKEVTSKNATIRLNVSLLINTLKNVSIGFSQNYIDLFFNLKNFCIANNIGTDYQKFSDYFIYKINPFTSKDNFEQIVLKNESLYLKPKDVFLDAESSKIKEVSYLKGSQLIEQDYAKRNSAGSVFASWKTSNDKKLVDYYYKMLSDKNDNSWIDVPFCSMTFDTKNHFHGGDGGYATCYVKIDDISYFDYSIYNKEPNTFNRIIPQNNFTIKNSKNSIISINLSNPENDLNLVSDQNFNLNDDSTIIPGTSLNINTNVGHSSYIKGNKIYNDFRKISGKVNAKIGNADTDTKYDFIGGGKRGRGITLNKYENAYYEDGGDARIFLQFLGPLSSRTFDITFNTSNCVTSVLTNTTSEQTKKITSPSSSIIEFKVNTTDKRYAIDFKKSTVKFTDCQLNFGINEFKMTLAELFEKSSSILTDKQWAHLNPVYEREDRYDYYYFSFTCLANCEFDIKATTDRIFNIDFEPAPTKISSIETTNDYDKRFGGEPANSVILNYGMQDYSISTEEYINYNSRFYDNIELVNDFRSLDKTSTLQLKNNNFLKIIQNLYKSLQLRLFVLNSVDLPSIKKYSFKDSKWTEYSESAMKGCYTSIEYSFDGKNFISYLNNELLSLTSNQIVYFKLHYNTERISIDEAASNMTNSYTIYGVDENIDRLKITTSEHFQILKVVMDNISKDINIMLKRNTYKIRFDKDLFNELYPETFDGLTEFEAGQLCQIRYQMKHTQKLSTHMFNPDDKEGFSYFNAASSIFNNDENIFESQIVLKNEATNSKYEVLPIIDKFGDYTNPFKARNGFEHLSTLNSKDGNVKPFQNPDTWFVNIQLDKIHSFKFSFPQQDVYIRLTADYIVGTELCEFGQGQQASFDIIKPGYYYTFIAGGRTGNGGNGGDGKNTHKSEMPGGAGGNGYYGGDGGSGGSTTKAYPYGTKSKWHGFILTGLGLGIDVYRPGSFGPGGIGYDVLHSGRCGQDGQPAVGNYKRHWTDSRTLGGKKNLVSNQRPDGTSGKNRFRGGISNNIFEFKHSNKDQIMNIFITCGRLGQNGMSGLIGEPGISGGGGSSGFPTIVKFNNFTGTLLKNDNDLWNPENAYNGTTGKFKFSSSYSNKLYEAMFCCPGPNASSMVPVSAGQHTIKLWQWGVGSCDCVGWMDELDRGAYANGLLTEATNWYGENVYTMDFVRAVSDRYFENEALGFGMGSNIEYTAANFSAQHLAVGGILGDVNLDFNKNLLNLNSDSSLEKIFIVPTIEYPAGAHDYRKKFKNTSVPETDCGFKLKFLSTTITQGDKSDSLMADKEKSGYLFINNELASVLHTKKLICYDDYTLSDSADLSSSVNLEEYLNVVFDYSNSKNKVFKKDAQKILDKSFVTM